MFVALLVTCGCATYPLGWNNQEVRDACGTSMTSYQIGMFRSSDCQQTLTDIYADIGSCHFSLSIYLFAIGLALLFTCLLFGSITVRKLQRCKSNSYENVMLG